MGGVQMKRLLRTHVVVVFGATSRIGTATIEALTQHYADVTVVLAVERPRDPHIKQLRRATGSYAVQCDYTDPPSLRRVVRNADAVLLVPALSPSGTQFSKRVLDACVAEDVLRIVLISSLLATDDYWRQGATNSLGYEAIEAHARSITNNCVALRIPLLMETLQYCRDEVIFANRFFSCFQPTTAVPCIAVQDVARAACEVLVKPATVKFNATYSLANSVVTCSPVEIERLLTHTIGRPIHAKYVSDETLTRVLKEKGVSEVVAMNVVRMKNFLELSSGIATHAALQTHPAPAAAAAAGNINTEHETKAPLPLTRVGYSNDYRTLTKHTLTTPQQWLDATRVYFERSAENTMQLFVMGSGEGLFQEIERLVAQQVTAPLAAAGAATCHGRPNVGEDEDEDESLGEATIPTATGAAVHSKATFCTIKTVPGGRQQQAVPLPAATADRRRSMRTGRRDHTTEKSQSAESPSPMVQLLGQLTAADVVVFVPPLRFGAAECMDVLRVVVDATQRARAWGIVIVSSVFTGRGWTDSVNRMGEMEQYIENSGVPYAIVRLPLFMEYFLALSPSPTPPPDVTAAAGASTTEEEKEVEPEPHPRPHRQPRPHPHPHPHPHPESPAQPQSGTAWPLLGRALATTPQYLISTADAAKALVSVAYTFPLHRNKIRTVYTERRTMQEIEACFQQHAYKHTHVEIANVDALHETRGREFWRVGYWTKHHVKQFLETEVALSGDRAPPLPMAESFQDLTECPPITLDKWAIRNAKRLAQALALADGSGRRSRRKSSVSSGPTREPTHDQREEPTRPALERSHEQVDLLHPQEMDSGEPRPMKMTATTS